MYLKNTHELLWHGQRCGQRCSMLDSWFNTALQELSPPSLAMRLPIFIPEVYFVWSLSVSVPTCPETWFWPNSTLFPPLHTTEPTEVRSGHAYVCHKHHLTMNQLIVIEYALNTLTHLFDELIREGTGGAKRLDFQRHVFFGLRVEGGVLNEAVNKHPQMALDVERFEVHTTLVLLLCHIQQLGDYLIHYVVNMSPTLQCVC